MCDPKLVILPVYLRHLATLVEKATPCNEPGPGECPVVSVPVDAEALREAADVVQRYIDTVSFDD